MSKLSGVSGRECLNALAKVGFRHRRQEGSHIVLRRDAPFSQVVVPDHKELDRGTLRAILRGAGHHSRGIHRPAIGDPHAESRSYPAALDWKLWMHYMPSPATNWIASSSGCGIPSRAAKWKQPSNSASTLLS
ncbi:MAG: type II toxin-antitoxin system HicA family toxin [Bryobacterales bacterium]|nr:type II toxin-antitoxin system HicA family toxin [Bryobacterales bacterium]